MEKYNFIIAMVIILGVCGAGFVFAYLKKKGFKTGTVLAEAQTIVGDVGTAIRAAESLAPNNRTLNLLDTIDKIVYKSVMGTNQMYISSQLPADQRKDNAKKLISAGLKIANISETPSLDIFIDAVLEQTIYDSKTDTEKKNQEQNTLQAQITQLTAEKAQLQASNTDLANKNTELSNKLNTVLSTVK
ncbi:bZIP transcription factor [Clostridium felsineum]|uniref:Uncharacterized protein n=1 Tax=Clostridium felsineum TaxID=36839 RepID=A0A1S8L018_9CLOT|nr:bZIP transcription factor [Clostridium felsineum]URZ06500.1 hypothetical protein CLROS_018330 [Clostridium felsineum]URZ11535.1 hypothetical protein CROST_022520 [Clostridium felsineum]